MLRVDSRRWSMSRTAEKDRSDIKIIEDGGSVMLFVAKTEKGRRWMDDNIGDDSIRIGTHGLAVEHRYVLPLARAMTEDGLSIHTEWTQ
jgi:hypothetical protein